MDVSVGVLVQQRLQLDLNVSLTEEQQRAGTVKYNYRRQAASVHASETPRPEHLTGPPRALP